MRLPRASTVARIRRAIVTILAISMSLSISAIVPAAMRRAADTNRAKVSGPASAAHHAAAGSDEAYPPVESPVEQPVEPTAEPPADRAAAWPAPKGATEDTPFTIELPRGWHGGELRRPSDDAARSFEYTDANDRSFIVNLDPDGSDFSADQVWRYSVLDGSRFTVGERSTCRAGEPQCAAGDGHLAGYILWVNGGSAMVGSHTYYFRFDDPAGEDADTDVFEQILRSIRVR